MERLEASTIRHIAEYLGIPETIDTARAHQSMVSTLCALSQTSTYLYRWFLWAFNYGLPIGFHP